MTITVGPYYMPIGPVTWKGVHIEFRQYVGGATALRVINERGLVATATVHLPHARLAPGCVWIKGWGENEGVEHTLISLGLAEFTGRIEHTGFTQAVEMRLLGPLAAAMP